MPSSRRRADPASRLGDLLRYWRRQRGRSQLELALDTGISQRHISFVESGRSAASRDLVLRLARALDVPLRECNLLLLAAGYAPAYAETSWDADGMRVVRDAVDRMLEQHEPHPAVVMDRHWNVLRTNTAAPRFFGQFVDLAARTGPRNILHLMFDPDGMRPFVEDWERVAAGLLSRVHREAVGRVLDDATLELLRELRAYPGVAALRDPGAGDLPVLPITFTKGGERWSYFSMVSIIGTPHCITAQEFRVECMFPVAG